MSQAIEVVIFKAKSGVSDAHLRTKAAAVTAILRKHRAFCQRTRSCLVAHWVPVDTNE